MRFCPYCGSPVVDEQKYCGNCGKPIFEPVKSNPMPEVVQVAPKKTNNKFWVGFLVALGVVFVWNFFFRDTTEEDYRTAVGYYEHGDYKNAQSRFAAIDYGYEATELYSILCEGHMNEQLSPAQVETLKAHLDFQDTKDLLLSCDQIGATFLNGYWRSEDHYTLECYKEGDHTYFQWNISTPKYDKENAKYWYIKDGMFGVVIKKDSEASDTEKQPPIKLRTDENFALFRISIINANSIAISSVDRDKRIVLTREQ